MSRKFIDSISKTSFVDYPDEIAVVVYTKGCNMNCSFCQTPHLIPQTEGNYSWDEVFEYLQTLKHITAVVFSGGEPTLNDLTPCIIDCHDLGLKIGLQTNGRGPYYQMILPFINYVLLSKHTPELVEFTKKYKHPDTRLDIIDVIIPS